jgi:hypothetical protein
MNSETFRALADALAAHLPHLRPELVRTEDGTVVARVNADRNNATPVVITFEAPAPVPEESHHRLSDPGRWRYQGDPPGTVFVDRSGHTPTPKGWQQYPFNYGGDAYPGAPIDRQWGAYKPDGTQLATLADLPAVIRFLRDGGY